VPVLVADGDVDNGFVFAAAKRVKSARREMADFINAKR
jgi:hypothetical protein